MTTISFYNARTHFSELLDEVAKGKQVLITRRGKPAALICPPPAKVKTDVARLVKDMLAFRDEEGPTLGKGQTIRGLIEDGRRF
jgi:prevent-host-death family protein